MSFNLFVTILFLMTLFFFHFNLSSNLELQLLSNQNEIPTQPICEVFLQMETFAETNYSPFELPNRLIYPSQIIFQDLILPNLNSEQICNLFKFFHSKNPSISPQNFLPPEGFFKSHVVVTIPELEEKTLYNFEFEQETQFSEFEFILYNPTDNTLEHLDYACFQDSEQTPNGSFLSKIGNNFFPFQSELNTQPFHDNKNKTVMIVTCTEPDEDVYILLIHRRNNRRNRRAKTFYLILEEITNESSKQYSIICNGKYKRRKDESSILLYEKNRDCEYDQENVEYPRDINFILKAKYMSGIQKYFFKFQYEHIKICQTVFENEFCWRLCWPLRKLGEFSDWALDNDDKDWKRMLTAFLFFYIIFPIELAKSLHKFRSFYVWLVCYKSIMGALLSPLFFYYTRKIFFLAFSLEPITASLFWGYTTLQYSLEYFRIYPIEQMFVIPTLKTPFRYIFREVFFPWLIVFALTSLVYAFLPEEKMSGEFLE